MSIFLNGVPGRLKTLIDRLVPSGAVETLTDSRLANLDDLDAAVSTRAPSATALSTATWTGTKAGYLDAAVSSVKYPVQKTIGLPSNNFADLNYYAPGVSSGDLTGTVAEALSVTAPGILWFACAYRGSGFAAATLNIRITIDGTVALLTTSSSTTTTPGTGVIGVGSLISNVPLLMPLRFTTSMKIEVLSSVSQSGGSDMAARYIYTLD